MVACAKFFGRPLDECTRGIGCVCKEREKTAEEILSEVDDVLNTHGYGSLSPVRYHIAVVLKMIQNEKKIADRYRDILRQIGYPKRGTEEERMDIFEAAKLIQSNFFLKDLQD